VQRRALRGGLPARRRDPGADEAGGIISILKFIFI
jgi:hypothetical protein